MTKETIKAAIETLDGLKRTLEKDLVDQEASEEVAMEDNDVIKALKEILEIMLCEGDLQRSATVSKALDLINRQKAELKQYAKDQHELMIEKDELFDIAEKQKAEIGRLHNILLSFTNEVHIWSNRMGYDTTGLSLIPILNEAESVRESIKNEATEFAERLTIHFGTYTDKDYLRVLDMVRLIDQIAKELKGESEWGMQKLQQPQGDNEVKCKDCEYLMFSDCYGECRKAYKGIVNPNDSCGKGKKRVKGEQ